MLKNIREREILNIMKAKNGFITVNELCASLYASESSIRRDLSALEEKGLIKRSYGGAELITSFAGIVAFGKRVHHNIDEKKAIAKKASSLVKENSVVFFDQSSTSFYLASELISKASITVITNNIEILSLLSQTKIKTISSGGILSSENRSCLIGSNACKVFESTYADIAFFSTKSLSFDGIISDCDSEEVAVRCAMLKNARNRVFLCDSEKFGTRSPYTQCSLSEVDVLVSESEKAHVFSELNKKMIIL